MDMRMYKVPLHDWLYRNDMGFLYEAYLTQKKYDTLAKFLEALYPAILNNYKKAMSDE